MDNPTPDPTLPFAESLAARWRRRTFSSLEKPNFLLFFWGQFISLVGTWMGSAA